ncbi:MULTISPECIES: MerR family transcriptional regulator [Microbacterium]|uniref:MerR family transcriptional regulator n=1 Tax=Microbacterium wangchenii TaxID=2541726 RepID=A0ABX5SRD5_9MICO|nr:MULTISPECIES: MerR family transcriptional regulator [Microbacterium]MCK6065246.1 MerR family transcriptional regulator [Microbacterium sp. EYE_512]QBR88696.1 MerR family transcriptional regulator [Microbacterium wangchenii]TXK20420.1 MerR family transcriptional regulator [Microbacterium wangchenii]
MLSIGQLAAYAGVTVRTVRHYHQVGLLPEPRRDHSGYRVYDADAVVRLIRIRTLAEAGVPLARTHQLLDAGEEEFEAAIDDIDRTMRAEIRRLQRSRRRLRQLAAGDQLTLPQSVVGYLARLRGLGIDERYIEAERDSWILITAQDGGYPVDAVIAQKHIGLDHPDVVALYRLVSDAFDWPVDDPRIEDIAERVDRVSREASETGDMIGPTHLEATFVDFLDGAATRASPLAERLDTILKRRGWDGWTHLGHAAVPANHVEDIRSDP